MQFPRGPAGSVQIPIAVQAESCGDEVAGWADDGVLKVHVVAPLDHGLANAAVERLLAAVLGIARRQVTVAAGYAGADKIVQIDGLDEDEVDRALPGRFGSPVYKRRAEKPAAVPKAT